MLRSQCLEQNVIRNTRHCCCKVPFPWPALNCSLLCEIAVEVRIAVLCVCFLSGFQLNLHDTDPGQSVWASTSFIIHHSIGRKLDIRLASVLRSNLIAKETRIVFSDMMNTSQSTSISHCHSYSQGLNFNRKTPCLPIIRSLHNSDVFCRGYSSRSQLLPTKLVRKEMKSIKGRGGEHIRRHVFLRSMVGVTEVDEKRRVGAVKEKIETVVIVGAGVTGLATALALHRVGVKALVLEQSQALRTEGTALSLFPNAWRALDALGVAGELRGQFISMTGGRMLSNMGKVIKEFQFSDSPGWSHEVRAVERKALLEVLAEPLPRGTIKFNARVKNICKPSGPQGLTEVELENGTVIRTKVLVGCDGARSVVASWMGLPEPRSVGQVAIRGLSDFKTGHTFEPVIQQIIGQGVRAGLVPVSSTKVYWFVLFNDSPTVPSRVTDPLKVKEEALEYIQGWPSDIQECVNMTPPEGFNRGVLTDRWSFPPITRQQASKGITLAGDASHPMTPNLAQGGCVALEDSIVLARKLYQALRPTSTSTDEELSEVMQRVGNALAGYQSERWARTFRLTVKSFVFGALLAWDSSIICFLRNNVALPIVFRASVVLGSTKYDCGRLPPPL